MRKEKWAASYKSTICHELRTPLQTVILYMRQIISVLNQASASPNNYQLELAESLFSANVSITQLYFMEYFVEDLLNLQMINSGVFTLEKQLFNP